MSPASKYFLEESIYCSLNGSECIWIHDGEEADCDCCRISEEYVKGE